jgi:AP-1 complex subunit gamma-1
VASCLEEKHHGVLLSSIAFMENALSIDENVVSDLVKCVPRIGRVYRMVVHETNSDFEIGGVQDPFLQVAILRFLRYLRRQTNTF